MMVSSASVPREVFYPHAGISSDGADDSGIPRMNPRGMPRYDTTRDADAVPQYTREYLQNLSAALDARLKIIDHDVTYYPEALAKTRKMHNYALGVLLVLGLLWLVTSIVTIIAIFKDNALGRHANELGYLVMNPGR